MKPIRGSVVVSLIGRGCYRVHYEDDLLDGGWIGKVPSLPGCVSQGSTLDELLANIKDAIVGILDLDEAVS